MPDTQQYTRAQFAQKIKSKYPAYAETDDNELVDKILAKYPQYGEQIKPDAPEKTEEELASEKQTEEARKHALEIANDVTYSMVGVPEPLRGVASAFTQGVLGLGKGALDLAKSTAFGLDDDVSKELETATAEERAELWDNFWNWADVVEDAVDVAGAGTSQAKGKFTDTSIANNLAEGNIAAAAELTAEQTASGVASLIPLVFGPAGAALLGASAAGSSFDEDISDVEKTAEATYGEIYGAALAKGGIEFASELVTAGILGKAKKLVSGGASKAMVRDYVQNSYKKILGSSVSEGVSEGLADTGGKLVDKAVYGTEYTADEYAVGFIDSAIVGAIIGGGVTVTATKGAERAAILQTTKSDTQIDADKARAEEFNTVEKQIQETTESGLEGSVLDQAINDTAKERKKEIVKEQQEADKEHARVIDNLPDNDLKQYAGLQDQVNKLVKVEKKLKKADADPRELEVVAEQIQAKREKAQEIYDREKHRPERVEAIKEADQKLDDKIAEQEAKLEDADKPQKSVDGKPVAKTAKQKLEVKKTKRALAENKKTKKALAKEAEVVAPPRDKSHPETVIQEAGKIKERGPRVAANIEIAQNPKSTVAQKNKAFNNVIKDNSQEIGAVRKAVSNKLFNLKGVKLDPATIDNYIKAEIAKLVNSHDASKGASLGSRILHPNFAKNIANKARAEAQTVKGVPLTKSKLAEKQAELDDIKQQVVDGILDPEAAEILKADIEAEYGTQALGTSIDKTGSEGELIVNPEVEALLTENPLEEADSEAELISKVLGGQSVDQLLKDIPGNKDKIFALLPEGLKLGSAFNGIFQSGNPDVAIWESYFDDRKRKAALKKQINKRLDESKRVMSTDVTPGEAFDSSLDFLEGKDTKVKTFLPLLAKLKRAFPGTKIIISKARMISDFIEAGIDPGKAETVKGYTDGSTVVLNPEKLDFETPIHEFGHIWAQTARKERPELYAKGEEVIRQSPYWIELLDKRDNQPDSVYYGYSDARLLEEAMATAIGQKGSQIFEQPEQQKIWDKIRQQIFDFVSAKLGIAKVEDLTLDQFVTLAATEIVTGEKFIQPSDVVAMQDSVINLTEFKEVGAGATRDYSRNNAPVTEYDTHKEYNRKTTEKQVYDAVNRYHDELSVPGSWFGITTGNFAETQSEIDALGSKYNKGLNDKILGKVKGLRKILNQEGYVMKRDPINPGFHQVYKQPRFEFLGGGRATGGYVPWIDTPPAYRVLPVILSVGLFPLLDSTFWKDISGKYKHDKNIREVEQLVIDKYKKEFEKEAGRKVPLFQQSWSKDLKDAPRSLLKDNLTYHVFHNNLAVEMRDRWQDIANKRFSDAFSSKPRKRALEWNNKGIEQAKKISETKHALDNQNPDRLSFLEVKPEDTGTQKKAKILNKLLNGKLTYKTNSPYKKSKVDQATREILDATKRDFALRGHLLNPAQIDSLIGTLENLVINGKKTQQQKNKDLKEVKKEVQEETSNLIKETSGVDPESLTPAKQRQLANQKKGFFAELAKGRVGSAFENLLSPDSNNDFYGLLFSLIPTGKGRAKAKEFLKNTLTDPLENANYNYLNSKRAFTENWNELQGSSFYDGTTPWSELSKKEKAKYRAKALRYLKESSKIDVDGLELSNSQVAKIYNYIKDPSLHNQLIAGGVSVDKMNEILNYLDSNPSLKKLAEGVPSIYAGQRSVINSKLDQHGYKGVKQGDIIPLKDALKKKGVDPEAVEARYAILSRIYNGNIPAVAPYTPFTAQGADTTLDVDTIFEGEGDYYSVMSGNLKRRTGGGALDIFGKNLESDMQNYISGPLRTTAFLDFAKGASDVFSSKNLKAMEAAYGKEWGDSMKESIKSIITGRNTPQNQTQSLKWLTGWTNNTVAGIMFFNTRSSVLQLISTGNFFAENPKLFTKGATSGRVTEAMELIKDSAWFQERGKGKALLEYDEIFGQEKQTKVGKGINWVLQKGYKLTQAGDKFAISAGGAPYVAGLLAEGKTPEEAIKAFIAQAEETQQSSRPERVGREQRSPLGRMILAFANTPMQYNRKMQKSLKDLRAPGSTRDQKIAALRKIAYYGAAQNAIFTVAQRALWTALDFEDEEDDKKIVDGLNSMTDVILRGSGIYGAAFATAKNILIELSRGEDRKLADKATKALVNTAPALGTKVRQLQKAAAPSPYKQSSGFADVDPSVIQAANAVVFTTNIPVDRALKKFEGVNDLFANDLSGFEKLMRLMGWDRYSLDAPSLKHGDTY